MREHWGIAAALGRLWVLTDGYTAPADACPAYRALLEALAAFEGELRRDVHEESNLLFAKARAESDRPTSE